MPAGYSFRPRGWALALAGAACVAGVLLGQWQAGRAEEKRAAAASVERARLQGVFVPEHTILLDNKLRRGRPGYEVVTPLRLGGSAKHLLVNRGWIAAGATRESLPEIRTPAGEVAIEGVVREHLPQVLQLGPERGGKVRQNLDVKAFAAQTGLALAPFVLEQHSPADDGLLREWPVPGAGAEKNQMYALQWYSLAALAVVLVIVLSLRKVE